MLQNNECPIKEKIEKIPYQLPNVKNSRSFAAGHLSLSGASNKNNTPGTSAPEEIPSINEKDFGFKDAVNELRRFFLDYPFLLEMGRQFSYAKDDIFF
ncbi:hypothetical protein TNCV_1292881 [Trichonephila clavipes]|nr:hypothetical protein TNCV_1292881 [Trichonephila clavipes]